MADPDPILFTIFLIFTGAAALATVALYARQALLVSYILLGFSFRSVGLRPGDRCAGDHRDRPHRGYLPAVFSWDLISIRKKLFCTVAPNHFRNGR